MSDKVAELEKQIFDLMAELKQARAEAEARVVSNYEFKTSDGTVSLLDLFGDHDKLIAIHNMGQGCRYCTLWADGFNGFVPHLENAASFVVLSRDAPDLQRRFAGSRGWRFRMASHGGGSYLKEQSVSGDGKNTPGVVCYERRGDEIYRIASSFFGPGDIFCSMWSLLSLVGLDESNWTPQFSYWSRPEKLCDGGVNVK